MKPAAIVFDFSRTLIFAHADVPSLNRHHAALKEQQPGYRVLEHFYMNTELLDFLRDLSKKLPLYVFSDGIMHSLPEISPFLKGIFTDTVSAKDLGYKKSEDEAYYALAYKLGYDPHQLLFVDDTLANVVAARAAGLMTLRYESNQQLADYLRSLGL